MTYKSEIFKTELDFIKNDKMKEVATELVEMLPDYTFEIPASASGKYHPSYTSGKGGLIRHTQAAVRIAKELLRLEMYSSINQYHDYIIMALIFHDGWKRGLPNNDGTFSEYMQSDHSKVCCNWLYALAETEHFKDVGDYLKYVGYLVLTHMGQWNLNYSTGEIFAPKPQTQEQMFVHLCDYLASRKCLEMNFDIPYSD